MENRRRHATWRWIAVAASLLIIGVPVALGGLYATGDLCEPPYGGRDSRLADQRYENIIETVVVRCVAAYPDGTEVEEVRVNWLGGGAALVFLIGTFFGSAALAGTIGRRPATIAATSCAAVCLVLVAVWFA